MGKPADLKACLDRLSNTTATDKDQKIVQQAVLSGQMVYAIGDRSVAVSGDASGASSSLEMRTNLDLIYRDLIRRCASVCFLPQSGSRCLSRIWFSSDARLLLA